jgi:mono/diheme cytochrome c family protein
MPAFASMLTDAQVAALTIYVRSQFSQQGPWTISERDVAKLRKETTEP